MHILKVLSWLGLAAYLYEFLRLKRIPRLGKKNTSMLTATSLTSVSAIVPARNEAVHILPCLAGLNQQAMHRLSTIIIDDQSQDETADLARSYTPSSMELSVVEGASLPNGWLGKSWACWQGAALAQGDWLLFMDVDVLLEPGLVPTLLSYAEAHHLDMVSLLPRIIAESLAEQLVLPAFFYLLMGIYPFESIHTPNKPAFALGQCVLIRRQVYEQVGGHAAVRQNIIEDVGLAQAVKAAGYRIAMLTAPDLLGVRMYAGWLALNEGMAKHARAGMGDTGVRAVMVATRQAFLAWLPLDLLLTALLHRHPSERNQLIRAGTGLFVVQSSLWTWALRRYLGLGYCEALMMPAGTLVYFLLAARAMLRSRMGQNLSWKGREI